MEVTAELATKYDIKDLKKDFKKEIELLGHGLRVKMWQMQLATVLAILGMNFVMTKLIIIPTAVQAALQVVQ
ncbi:MAG: hypothetical protein NZ697_04790 [Porticoccaceae bacterium]|nr:hypothetical protein [Porticoccaceae bacterium]